MTRLLLPALAALAISACGGSQNANAPAAPERDTAQAPQPAQTPAAPTAETIQETVEATAQEVANAADALPDEARLILTGLGESYLSADLANGARQFRRCQSCHTLNEGGRHTVGPNLHGTVGVPAAGQDGFSYSRQLTEAGLVWDADTLDAWINNPRALVPGNRMSFVGLRDADDRRDVIAYIAVETAN